MCGGQRQKVEMKDKNISQTNHTGEFGYHFEIKLSVFPVVESANQNLCVYVKDRQYLNVRGSRVFAQQSHKE